MEQYWAVLFFAGSIFNGIKEISKVEGGFKNHEYMKTKLKELIILGIVLLVSVKMEKYLSKHIVEPILNRIFGDLEEERRRIEEEERDLSRMLAQARNQGLEIRDITEE
jgi:hypothetical protein